MGHCDALPKSRTLNLLAFHDRLFQALDLLDVTKDRRL